MEPDTFNGMLEFLGSGFILMSIFKLMADKLVRGVHWGQVGFFTIWSLWNLFYYPYLGQWVSFMGGVTLVIANTVYLSLLIYYTVKEKNEN